MALWIRISENAVVSSNIQPHNGKTFSADELHELIGGFYEVLWLSDGRIMWLNEEGKLQGLPPNPVADLMAHEKSGIAPWDHIVGNVVITTREEAGEDDEEEE